VTLQTPSGLNLDSIYDTTRDVPNALWTRSGLYLPTICGVPNALWTRSGLYLRRSKRIYIVRCPALTTILAPWQMARLSDALGAERRVREETENTMLRMLEDMAGRLQAEIAAERRDREGTEEVLLKLLEETCSRVELGLRG
jgi:hypothetical protein